MADSVRLNCWPSQGSLVIGIQVKNLLGQLHTEVEELVQIDTGYNEELLVPYSLFEKLNLQHWSLPEQQNPVGSTVTGQVIHFIEAYAEVIIPKTGEHYPIIAQTFVGNTRFLIGRAFLRHFKLILDGPGKQTCLLTPT